MIAIDQSTTIIIVGGCKRKWKKTVTMVSKFYICIIIHHTPHFLQDDSPTFPVYAVVMGKEKPRAEDGDVGPQPKVPPKQLTEEDLLIGELNLLVDQHEVCGYQFM